MNVLSKLDLLADIQFIDYWDNEFLLSGLGADTSLDIWNADSSLGTWDTDILLNELDDVSVDNGSTGI